MKHKVLGFSLLILIALASCSSNTAIKKIDDKYDLSSGRLYYPVNSTETMGTLGFDQFKTDFLPLYLPGRFQEVSWPDAQTVIAVKLSHELAFFDVFFEPVFDQETNTTYWIHKTAEEECIVVELLYFDQESYQKNQLANPWKRSKWLITQSHKDYQRLSALIGDTE